MKLNEILIICGICILGTTILCCFARRLSTFLNILDSPDERKLHRHATPLLGGLAIVMVVTPIFLSYLGMQGRTSGVISQYLVIGATLVTAIVGLADDRHSLSASGRVILGFLIFSSTAIIDPIFLIRGLTFSVIDFQFGLGTFFLALLFTTICCVGLVNAINMADGKNGLVISLCLGWLIFLATRAPEPFLPLIALLCSSLLVLLMFNLRSRLFLGDGGAYGFGCAVSLITIAVYNSPGTHSGLAITADEIVLLFSVPVFDSFRLTFVRMRRGQSPMAPDRDHLHHHLQNKFGWPGGLVVYLIVAAAPMLIVKAIS